jgi:hypothetical protein
VLLWFFHGQPGYASFTVDQVRQFIVRDLVTGIEKMWGKG